MRYAQTYASTQATQPHSDALAYTWWGGSGVKATDAWAIEDYSRNKMITPYR